MVTTIELKQAITQEKYNNAVALLKKIGILVKEQVKDDTKMSKEDFFTMVDQARAGKKTKATKQQLLEMLYN